MPRTPPGAGRPRRRRPLRLVLGTLAVGAGALALAGPAGASPTPSPDNGTGVSATLNHPDQAGYTRLGGSPTPAGPAGPTPGGAGPTDPRAPATPRSPAAPGHRSGGTSVTLHLGRGLGKPSTSIVIIIALTLLSVAPALLIMLTSFSRIVIVLSLTRNALGLQSIPPNQVLVGLALFLSLFLMAPTISKIDHRAVQPYLAGHLTAQQAWTAGEQPLHSWMIRQTSRDDLALFVHERGGHEPASVAAVPMVDLVPAFILSEIKTGFTIGFIIFIPFLIIDLIVSSTLMSMGMMMLPPSLVSLPFKLLLFVMVDGWGLVVKSLLASFH